MKFSSDSMMLASGAIDGTVFFFELEPDNMQTYIPLCMIKLESKVTDMCWDSLAKKLLISLDNGKVYIVERPKKAQIDNTETYLV